MATRLSHTLGAGLLRRELADKDGPMVEAAAGAGAAGRLAPAYYTMHTAVFAPPGHLAAHLTEPA